MESDVNENDNLNEKADKIKRCVDKIAILKEY